MAFGKEQPINWRTFSICVFISLGQLVSAYSTVIIGTTLGKPDFMKTVGLWDAKGNPTPGEDAKIGAVVGLFQAGAVLGTLIASFILDKWGRKMGLIYSSVVCFIGIAGLTGSVNLQMFLVFRFVTGLGSWGYAAVSALYIAELSPPQYRGFFAGLNGVMIGAGCAVGSYVGMGFFFSTNLIAQWRAPLGIALIFPLTILCITPFIPESPRYLLLKDETEKAWQVVSKLHKTLSDPDQISAKEEFYQMTKQAEYDRQLDSSWIGLLSKPSYLKRIYLGCTLTFFGQSTAVIVINNYGTTFYKALGFSAANQQILQGNRDLLALLGNIFGSLLVDRFGRKAMILFGFIGCLVCLCIEATMVAMYSNTTNVAGKNTGVAFIYIYLAFFSMGIDVGTYVFLGEMFPNHIRAKGIALSLAVLNVTNTIYLTTASLAFAAMGWKFFMIFAALTAVGIVWISFSIPETKGVPLEEISAMFGDEDEVIVYLNTVHIDPITQKPVVDGEKANAHIDGEMHHVEYTEVGDNV